MMSRAASGIGPDGMRPAPGVPALMGEETPRSGTTERTAAIRRSIRRAPIDLGTFLRSPGIAPTLAVWGLFAIVCSLLAMWAWERPLVAVGRVMNETATVRVKFQIEDRSATEEARKAERQRTPRVYVVEPAVVQDLQASLANLPRTVA